MTDDIRASYSEKTPMSHGRMWGKGKCNIGLSGSWLRIGAVMRMGGVGLVEFEGSLRARVGFVS